MHKNKTYVFLAAVYAVYFFINLAFRDQIINILNFNLPLRESYFPTVAGLIFVYLYPMLLGYFVSKSFRSKTGGYLFYVNLALLAGILNYLPYLINNHYLFDYWFNGIAVAYNSLFFPILFLIGCFGGGGNFSFQKIEIDRKITKKDIAIALSLGTALFVLNLVPFTFSKFLPGADVYYHGAMTERILQGRSIFKSPIFYEGKNYYYSIVYPLLALVSKIFSVGVDKIWFFYNSVCSFIIAFYFYLFAKRNIGSDGAMLASAFALTSSQILWTDPSIRTASYVFLMIFLYNFQSGLLYKKTYSYVIAAIAFILTLVSHPEIGLHIVGIVLAFIVLYRYREFFAKIPDYFSRWKRKPGNAIELNQLGTFKTFSILFLLFAILLSQAVFLLVRNYSIMNIVIFTEIPLSIFHPIGIISFLAFLFVFAGLYSFLKHDNSKVNILTLAVSSIFLTTIFFFTHIWTLYHRYFAETAYFGLAIAAAYGFLSVTGKSQFFRRYNKYFIIGVNLLLLFSLLPKFMFIINYSKASNDSIEAKNIDMQFIMNNTDENSVIMMNPNNILGRYVPLYTGRYLLEGSNRLSKEQQWEVLSFCNGPFGPDCYKRYDIAKNFYDNPTPQNLELITDNYRLDYILADMPSGEAARIDDKKLDIQKISNNTHYELYAVGK